MLGIDSADEGGPPPSFEPIEIRLEALQLGTKFVFGTLWQSGDVATVLEWRTALCALYRDEVAGSHWFLNELSGNETLLLELLVSNESKEVRELMAVVLAEAIATASKFAASQEHAEIPQSGSTREEKGAGRRRSSATLPPSFEFIFILFRLMPSLLTVPTRHHREYFTVLLDFALSGVNECAFTVVNSVVGAIVGLLTGMGQSQPLLQNELRRVKGRTILKRIELDPVILKLLSLLIRCGPPPAVDIADAILPPQMTKNHAELTVNDHEVLLNERFITLLIQRASHYTKETKSLEQIIVHLCWESRRVTSIFIDKIMNGIEGRRRRGCEALLPKSEYALQAA
ncbi:hypothetical protein PINS_up012783 [Pythium insidiosum]|nr:hypothetical protein PINS_up012783 [Pythium insidiosum]